MPAESGGFEVPAGTSGFGAAGASGGFLPYPGAGEYDGPDTDAGVPVTGTFDAVLAGATGDDPADPAALAAPAGSVPADTERLYGQIAIYTLLDEGAEEFDQLSTRVVEQVQAKERGTLVYVVHGVPSAPLQRILYEVYRDRAAYDEHTRQPYIADFKSQCKPLVLATNVIELGVMQAKMSLLAAERDAAARNAAGRDRR
jgi:quinol monooxygenase YgiN